MINRRAFVATTSRAVAGGAVLGRVSRGGMRIIPRSVLRTNTTAESLFASRMQSPDLPGLAQQALEAAKGAGATFADIRLAEWYRLQVGGERGRVDIQLDSNFSYGLRVVANGAWSFIRGCVPDADQLVAAARDATATAVGFAKLKVQQVDLAPRPVAQGEWTTPHHGDPFVIPLQDQADLLDSYVVSERVHGGTGGLGVNWLKEYRVYGSTDGSLISQTLYRSRPDFFPGGHRSFLPWAVGYPAHLGLPMSGGYETLQAPGILDNIKAAVEIAAEASRLPAKRIDVGRYPVVLDGRLLGQLFGQTVGVALEADRVLGYENDSTGISYLAPPEEILGKKVINPMLNASANRAMPHFQAVKWDDDGVEPEEYAVMKDGVVVDYHTSRQTATRLTNWYQSQGRPVRSHGCAVASDAGDTVTVLMPHLTVAPGAHDTSVEDLYHDMSHGLLVTGRCTYSIDRALASGNAYDLQAFEIVKGKVVGRVKEMGLEFQTMPLWKSLTAIGGSATMSDCDFVLSKGIPWEDTLYTASAPAGLFSAVNVIVNTGPRFL